MNRAALSLSPPGVGGNALDCGREEQPSYAGHPERLEGFGSLWVLNLCNSKNVRGLGWAQSGLILLSLKIKGAP